MELLRLVNEYLFNNFFFKLYTCETPFATHVHRQSCTIRFRMVWATPTKSAVVAIGVVVCAALLAATHSYERVAVALVLVAVGYLLAMGNSLLVSCSGVGVCIV